MKNFLYKKNRWLAWALLPALMLGAPASSQPSAARAQEISAQETPIQEGSAQETLIQEGSAQETPGEGSAVREDAAVSLDYVSNVKADVEGRVLRVYGDPNTDYAHPISISASCTVILDNVKNDADLTVADGVELHLILRGNNRLSNIRATGGSGTLVRITGEGDGGTLNTGDIACSTGGTTQTGAAVCIENCSVFCRNLGCGANGADVSAWEGSATIARAVPGSNASPKVTVIRSNISVSGNMACGGDGVHAQGTWGATTSSGGSSGSVDIAGSYVTVGGNVAVGGKGGGGELGSSYYDCRAGDTRSSSPVTITDHSSVNVAGNVASQPNLPGFSSEGTQNGLHGVTVTVTDSSLSAKDIGSGGAGHTRVHQSIYTGSGASYNVYGTMGGNGGTLIAERAVIECEQAVCGANAGDYMKYEVSTLGTTTGDVECARHPQDGRGGSIRAVDSVFTVKNRAAAKGSRWDGYPNPSVYGDSSFIGGTLNGRVYGGVITTDMTSILGGGFTATEIRNSEEASCAKCTLKTDVAMANETVQISANALGGTVMLDGDGSMCAYLGIGKESVKISGAGVYFGTFMVKRSETLNVFELEPYGVIDVGYGGAVIRAHTYTHTNEVYDYDGDFTVRGSSDDAAVTVEEGAKRVTLKDTSFDTLNVNGTSVVTLVLTGESHIRAVNVAEGATLIIEGDGSLYTAHLGNEHGANGKIEINSGDIHADVIGGGEGSREILIKDDAKVETGESRVPLRDENGNLLYVVEFVAGSSGTYALRLNDRLETVEFADDGSVVRRLLAAGNCVVEARREPFRFRGEVTIREAQRIYLDDLTLYADVSAGEIHIRDGETAVGDDAIKTDAEIRITQSGETSNAVYVEKKTASIILDGVSPDLQIYLPDDFEGIIRDAANRPIQVVTVQTGFSSRELSLYLDGKYYVLMTNEKGNLSILTGRGMHRFGLKIDGMEYRCKDSVSISSTEHTVRFSDMVLVWDVALGSIEISDTGFAAGACSGSYTGGYLLVQSSAPVSECGMVSVNRDDAVVTLSDEVDALLQMKLTDDFHGSVQKGDTPLYPLVVATGCTGSALKVSLDGHEGMLMPDADGRLYLIAAQGTHALTVSSGQETALLTVAVSPGGTAVSLEDLLALTIPGLSKNAVVTVSVGDANAQVGTDENGSCRIRVDPSIQEIIVTDAGKTFRYPIVDGVPGEPQPYEPQTPGTGGTGNGSGTGGNGSTGSGSGTNGSGNTGGNGTAGGSGGAGGSGSGAAGGANDQSGAKKPGDKDHADTLDGFGGRNAGDLKSSLRHRIKRAPGGSADGTENRAKKPKISVTSSLKGVRLVAAGTKNSYQLYSKHKVRLTVQREADTEYYYKIVRQGQHNRTVAWKRLKGERLFVRSAARGQRVFLKAVNAAGTTVKKTTGFVVDTKKPTVTGVKNAAVYKRTRMVVVSDSGGIATVKLNGKKMPARFVITKSGIYRLVVTDRAGNKKQVFFAVV